MPTQFSLIRLDLSQEKYFCSHDNALFINVSVRSMSLQQFLFDELLLIQIDMHAEHGRELPEHTHQIQSSCAMPETDELRPGSHLLAPRRQRVIQELGKPDKARAFTAVSVCKCIVHNVAASVADGL